MNVYLYTNNIVKKILDMYLSYLEFGNSNIIDDFHKIQFVNTNRHYKIKISI